jgi:hypothetical protein
MLSAPRAMREAAKIVGEESSLTTTGQRLTLYSPTSVISTNH